MAILTFQYDPNNHSVGLFDEGHHEGGQLPRGQGVGGHPIEAFKQAVYGKLLPVEGSRELRLVPAVLELKIVG